MPIKSGTTIECHFLLADELGQMIQFMRQCRALPRDSDEPQVLLVLGSPTLCAVRRQGSP